MRYKPLDETKHRMRYKPLDQTNNEIRVLKFLNLSSPVSTEDTIRCSIRNVSLGTPRHLQWHQDSPRSQKFPKTWDRFTKAVDLRDLALEDVPLDKAAHTGLHGSSPQCSGSRYDWGEFEALSYTWGDAGETKIIYVNGVRKSVSRNLEEALRALRGLEETLSGMRYWIDALCIDQENIEERNVQVQRMKEIYGRARAVIVWLGQEEFMDRSAIQAMHHLCYDEENALRPPSDPPLHKWPALFAVTQKPYWNRCWIIQELAMNHNSTLFLCGKFKMTRKMIQSGALWGRNRSHVCEEINHQTRLELHIGAWAVFDRIYNLIRITPKRDIEMGEESLLDLVRRADATDKRDKIYSILGLLDPAISAGVTPNYSFSVQQVYTNFMKSFINASKRLDLIAFGDISVEQGWPSWVPDWRKPFQGHHIDYVQKYQASRDIPAQFRFIEKEKNRTSLACSGFEVDTVDGIAAEPPLDSHATRSSIVSERYNGQTLEAIKESFRMGHPVIPTELLFAVPWDLSPDTHDNILSNPEWLNLFCSIHFLRWDKFRRYNKDFCIGGQKFQTFFPKSYEQDVDVGPYGSEMRSILRFLEHRALITTRTGYVGLAPEAAHPGDVVAILLGCRWPVVLRPRNEDRHQVVGGCYIHGFMDGEILDQQRDGHVSEREFILC